MNIARQTTKFLIGTCVCFVVIATSTQPVEASGLLKELFKMGGRLSSKRGAAEAAEQAAKHGARRSAAHGGRLMTRHGDDAARGVSKAVGEGASYADNLAAASRRLTPQNARRLAMMKKELEATGQAPQVMSILAKHGKADEAMEFLWRNRGTLVGGAAVTSLCMNPDLVLGSATDLGKHAISAGSKEIFAPAVKTIVDTVKLPMGIAMIVCFVGVVVALMLRFLFPQSLVQMKRNFRSAAPNPHQVVEAE